MVIFPFGKQEPSHSWKIDRFKTITFSVPSFWKNRDICLGSHCVSHWRSKPAPVKSEIRGEVYLYRATGSVIASLALARLYSASFGPTRIVSRRIVLTCNVLICRYLVRARHQISWINILTHQAWWLWVPLRVVSQISARNACVSISSVKYPFFLTYKYSAHIPRSTSRTSPFSPSIHALPSCDSFWGHNDTRASQKPFSPCYTCRLKGNIWATSMGSSAISTA